MKRRGVLLCVVALCAIAGPALAATGGNSLPFNARGSGTGSTDTNSAAGTAQATHMGAGPFSFQSASPTTVPLCPTQSSPASGTLDLTAANGDVVRTALTGTVCGDTSTNTVHFTGTFTIDGGTGGFTGSSGGGTMTADAVFSDPAGRTFAFTFQDDGVINY